MIKRSLAWMGFAQAASLALQFGSTVVLARFLTPYQSGIYAVGASIAGVLATVQAFGLQALIVREERLTPEIEATAFAANGAITVLLALLIAVASLFGGSLFQDAGVGRVLRVLAVIALFGIFTFLPSAKLEREGRFGAMSIVGVASSLIGTALTIALAVLGYTYMSIAYAGIGSALAYAVMINVAGREHARFRVGFTAWRRVAEFGLQMLAVSGINSVSLRLSEVALGRIDGLSALGFYNRASALNGLLWSNVHMVIGRVILVDYASHHRRGLPLRERYLRTVEVVTALLWPAFAGFAVLAGPFILVVYGQRWVPAAVPLRLLAVASMILVSITMTWELFAATGRLREQTRIEFIRSLLAVAAFVAGCTISLTAAAGARIVDAVITFVLYRPYLNRMTGTSLPDFLPIYARSAALTALAVAPVALVMADHRMRATTPLPLLALATLSGMALWAFGLFAFRHPLAGDARQSLAAIGARVARRTWRMPRS